MDWKTKEMWLKRVARQIDYIFRPAFGKVMFSGMHPIGKVLNFDAKNEYQNRGPQHSHFLVHVYGASQIDVGPDITVKNFIEKYITCSLPCKKTYPKLHELAKTLETYHHTFTCRKKKGCKCRFNYPCPPSEDAIIVRGQDISKETWKQSKAILNKVLVQILICEDFYCNLEEIFNSYNVSEYDFYDALHKRNRKLSIHHKQKPNEKDISPYNTVTLSLIKSNMNLQYVTGIYGLLTYLTSYLCKSETTMGELMRKDFKESSSDGAKDLRKAGNVYLKTRKVSAREAIAHAITLSSQLPNSDVLYLPFGLNKNRIRMLKSQDELDKMEPSDKNIFQVNIIDKYANRPGNLENMCLADFGTTYIGKDAVQVFTGSDNIKNYTIPVSAINVDDEFPVDITEQLTSEQQPTIITLKNDLGKMKKKSHPCVVHCHMKSKLKNPQKYDMTL